MIYNTKFQLVSRRIKQNHEIYVPCAPECTSLVFVLEIRSPKWVRKEGSDTFLKNACGRNDDHHKSTT